MNTVLEFFSSGERLSAYYLAAFIVAAWWVGSRLLGVFKDGGRAGRLEREPPSERPRRRIPLE